MMTQSFTQWVVWANVLAWPVAYLAASKWLEAFAYRISIRWELFVLSGGLALTIAIITVGFISMKTARANPASVLRDE
ncbi:hypothetical protein KAR48_16120 [bacterium]|nr:hypothetical protein [bacterium]